MVEFDFIVRDDLDFLAWIRASNGFIDLLSLLALIFFYYPNIRFKIIHVWNVYRI